MPMSEYKKRSVRESELTEKSFDPSKEFSDGYILSAFGDISLTNACFLPSLPSELPPRGEDPVPRKPKRTTHPLMPKHTLPSVIQNIMPLSPLRAILSPREDFGRTAGSSGAQSAKGLEIEKLTPAKNVPLVTSAHQDTGVKVETGDNPKIKATPGVVTRAPSTPTPAQRPKEKPLRGYARLPRRPPLPRWDLSDPSVYRNALEEPRSLYGSVPSKLMNRT